MDHLVAEVLPACPGVGFFGDTGGCFRCVVGLGIGPRHSQGHGEGSNSLPEDALCSPHDAAQIVLAHVITSLILALPSLRAASAPLCLF